MSTINMGYLLLCILSSTLIFITFKISGNFKFNLVKLITVNYFIASLLGLIFYKKTFNPESIFTSAWFPHAIIIGILFILFFFLIGKSTQVAGLTVTTIAGKMSMAIPVFFSILYFSEEITVLKIAGLIAAFAAVLLTIYKPDTKAQSKQKLILPLIIFAGTGIADSLIKYTQHFYVKNELSILFSSVVFFVALILSILYNLIFETDFKEYTKAPLLLSGIILGTVNFGSLYFLIQALEQSCLESSIVFGINNLGIVSLSVIIGYFIFSEKMNRINLLGIILAIMSIFILTKY